MMVYIYIFFGSQQSVFRSHSFEKIIEAFNHQQKSIETSLMMYKGETGDKIFTITTQN